MEKQSSWIAYVEAFVDSFRPSSVQAASLNGLTVLVNKGALTFEELVRGMEQYLTTSDHVIRGRGILLLAEIVKSLAEKPLDSQTIHSLAEFFTAKLEDWHALRGVLIGCLALLRRSKDFGMVERNDALALAQSFLKLVHVQSLAVLDRKLCFELLQCLLDIYPDAVVKLGEDLIYGLCGAIDEEKDPRCLMLTFHLVKSAACLFPDPSGPFASFSADLFAILSQYFPIYFTHPKSDSLEVTRGDLSTSLMYAFTSTTYLEPFVIPLLLEKLSSSLPLAKIDSLKYLNNCIQSYGSDKMIKHAKDIWYNIRDVIFKFPPERPSLLSADATGDLSSDEYQIAKEAINCLRTAMLHLNLDQVSFLNLIIEDKDIKMNFELVSKEISDMQTGTEMENKMNALGVILSTASKVSMNCCTIVFQKFFPCLMDVLGISSNNSSTGVALPDGSNFGALYLSIELLASCRDLSLVCREFSHEVVSEPNSWFCVLKRFSGPLCYALGSVMGVVGNSILVKSKVEREHFPYAVKGLEILATFPRSYAPISEAVYKEVLAMLMAVITDKSDATSLWKLSLHAIVQIGLFAEKNHELAKEMIYNKVVVEPIVSFPQHKEFTMPLALKLGAMSEIGGIKTYILRVIRALEEAIFSNLEACIKGHLEAAEVIGPIIECYSNQLLSRYNTSGGFEDVAIQFSDRIWDLVGNMPVSVSNLITTQGLLDKVMVTMKLLVRDCTEEGQFLILQKAYSILSSMNFCHTTDLSAFPLSKPEGFGCTQNVEVLCREEWILSLFASIVIALRPQTPLIDVNILLNLFMAFLLKGYESAAQALASIVNKWPGNVQSIQVPRAYTLDEAMELIFDKTIWDVERFNPLRKCVFLEKENSFIKSVIFGLAWVGKGLLMRGHEKLKDVTMLLLKFLVSCESIDDKSLKQSESGEAVMPDIHFLLATSAADAFHIILSDSEACLNKKFHAVIKPLYKQRFFSIMLPILLSSVKDTNSSSRKGVLYRAFGNIIANAPLAAVISEGNKIIPFLMDALTILSLDAHTKDLTYNLLLVLSGILMHDFGKEAIVDNINTVIDNLIQLTSCPHMMLVRETAIQCLVAMSSLPHTRIYPMRPKVLRAVSIALDDRKRAVRQEAIRCRQTWASIASRSLQF